MSYRRLPESLQTLYAELLEQAILAEAEAAALEAPRGSFVAKSIKGRTYWYLQHTEGDRRRQHYLGSESPDLARLGPDLQEGLSRRLPDLREGIGSP